MNSRFNKTNYKNIIILIVLLLLFIPTFNTRAQTIDSPTYLKRNDPSIRIDEIERNANYTIIKGVYKDDFFEGQVWISETTYLKDCNSGHKYTIIRSEGLPMGPEKLDYEKGQIVHYTFYFPSIENDVEMVDMIELETEDDTFTSSFNFYGIALKEGIEREFKICYNKGQKINSKPSLQRRIDGVREIQLYVPNNMSNQDEYIYGVFARYLENLGLSVDIVPSIYESKTINGILFGRFFEDKVSNYLTNANTVVAINYAYNYGEIEVIITFIDPINKYTWEIPVFDLPNKAEKYNNKLKKNIAIDYNYNSNYAYVLPSTTSTWNESILREYLTTEVSDHLEGIYKGDQLQVGIKRDDGKYYLLYLSGASNTKDWKEGEIKATLTATATPTLFKADWLGRYKQNKELTVSFMNGVMIVYDKDNHQETYIKMFPNIQTITHNDAFSGTGFLLSEDGYIITNHHVIENARTIKVSGINDDVHISYAAKVEISDKQNDLAILKIIDSTFKSSVNIPYTFKYTTSSVGEDCFVLGYPLISTMGKDIKLTNGIISSKTGYEGNIAEYQMSAPVQPGNSGGPLFDKNGNIIGVVCAKHREAENVGYAIKASYIRNLVELLPMEISMPQVNLLYGKSLPEQVELASKAVCLIIVNDD